jgi:ribosomal protein L29
MKFNDLKGLGKEELAKKKTELQFELLKARAQSVRGTVAKNPHNIGGMKRALSRIETLLHAVPVKGKTEQKTRGTKKT